MSKSPDELKDTFVRLIEDADEEMLAMGYQTAADPSIHTSFGGKTFPDGEWEDLHMTVSLRGELTEWLRERNMLTYLQTNEGDHQKITDLSFVLGGIAAALNLTAKEQVRN